MTRRQRRAALVAFVTAGAAATIALTVTAFQQNMLFFYTPSQAVSEGLGGERAFRLGGMVAEESVRREDGSIEVQFAVTDMVTAVTVSYSGVLPNLFREGQGVVVRGRWHDGTVVADEVLAKHDENYMPVEVSEALKAAETLQQ